MEWEILARKTELAHYSRRVDRVQYRLPDGNEADFYIKVEPNSAAVLPVTADGKVVLAKQFRPGPGRMLYELPGGSGGK